MKVEYRVRPITRFQVTRYHESPDSRNAGTEQKGEYDNAEVAYQVAYALAREEHQRLGYPLDDMRIMYPSPDGPGGPMRGRQPGPYECGVLCETVGQLLAALAAFPEDATPMSIEPPFDGVAVLTQGNGRVMIGGTRDIRRAMGQKVDLGCRPAGAKS